MRDFRGEAGWKTSVGDCEWLWGVSVEDREGLAKRESLEAVMLGLYE